MAKGTRARTRKRITRSRRIERHDGESSPLYTARELAAILGVQLDTLRKWRIQGKGPPFIRETRITVVYRKVDVDQWLAQSVQRVQTVEPRAPRKKTPADENNGTTTT